MPSIITENLKRTFAIIAVAAVSAGIFGSSADAANEVCEAFKEHEVEDHADFVKHWNDFKSRYNIVVQDDADRVCSDLKHMRTHCPHGNNPNSYYTDGIGFKLHFKDDYCSAGCTFDKDTGARCK